MKKLEKSKLTGGFKISKKPHVIPSTSMSLRAEQSNLSVNSARDLKKAARVLKNGGVVIFPTDTVYGIGCLYNNKEGLLKIYKIKNRPQNLPLPILVSSIKQAESIVNMNELAKSLAKKYWPGGLTIILPLRHPELDYHRAKDLKTPKLGIRIPNSKIVLSLIKQVGIPIIGTSANFHGKESVANFESLDPKLINLADYVLKGECAGGIESTIVDVTQNNIKILRKGAVSV